MASTQVETTKPETTKPETIQPERRVVPANLHESTPNVWGYWILASPMLIFLLWLFLDFFVAVSPLSSPWLDRLIGLAVFGLLIVLPLGVLAHRIVTTFPKLFQHAGWDIEPLEPVKLAELYLVKYTYQARLRSPTSWSRLWIRAAHGWVYLEILAILGGFFFMPLAFMSAMEFGFGQ